MLDTLPKSPLHLLAHPVPPRGALAIVTNEGRVAVDAAASGACGGRRAGLSSVSERSAQTIGAKLRPNRRSEAAYGKTVWSWHPLLVSSRRRSVDPTGFEQSFNPPATEAKRTRLRGEPGISRKTIAQGMPDALRCPVCSCASHHSFAHETAGAARTRHSLRPLHFRANDFEHLGRIAPRDRGVVFSACHVIAGRRDRATLTVTP